MNKQVKKAIKLTKKIQKYERIREKFRGYVKASTKWIQRDKAELKKVLTAIPEAELLLYGELMGYTKKG